jgi:hypothetical protein
MIIGASDRMLTAGDIEFESAPTSTGKEFVNKVTAINNSDSIVVMLAGDFCLQTEIVMGMMQFINASEKQSGKKWGVKDAVNLYIDFYNQVKSRLGASAILSPLQLNQNTFIARQKEMSDGFSEIIARDLIDFPMPGVKTIIAGIDDSGSHLYKLHNNQPTCCDSVGFAAIGSGAKHAESQFMLRGYSRIVPQEEALWLTYMAKRKSEVAPGVGEITDLFCIDTKNKKYRTLNDRLPKSQLDKIYASFEEKELCAFRDAQKELKQSLEKLA